MTCCRCLAWKRKSSSYGICWQHEVYMAEDGVWPCFEPKVISVLRFDHAVGIKNNGPEGGTPEAVSAIRGTSTGERGQAPFYILPRSPRQPPTGCGSRERLLDDRSAPMPSDARLGLEATRNGRTHRRRAVQAGSAQAGDVAH